MQRHITRSTKAFLALLLGMAVVDLSLSPASAVTPEEQTPTDLYFTVMRDDAPMGYHRVEFYRRGENLVVETEIDLRVKVAFITLFRYRHQSEEIWSNGELVSLTSKTNDNGKKKSVVAIQKDGQISVEGTAYEGSVPKDIVPSSYWNFDLVSKSQMLNTQTGEVVAVQITPSGEEKISVEDTTLSAKRYNILGTADLDVWYDNSNTWVGSQFTVRGTTLTYVLTDRGNASIQFTGGIDR